MPNLLKEKIEDNHSDEKNSTTKKLNESPGDNTVYFLLKHHKNSLIGIYEI